MNHRANRPLKKYRWSGDRPTGLRHKGLHLRVGLLAVICATLFLAGAASAETVEVTPGVQVTKKAFSGPTNEQPFFGFVAKDAAQKAADEKFVKAMLEAAGTREKAFDETTKRGWRAVTKGNAGEAAQRFNQAFLLAPEQSGVYHGFAVIAQMRFRDNDFADEMFRIARKQPNPLKSLNADYGKMLLIAKRPREAQEVLEQAVKDAPDLRDAWTNLAWARLQNGDAAAACAAADEAVKQRPSGNANSDLTAVRSSAQCK
ncbi:MAG: tetratricopeptide repeat protein [Pseudomonadota bacterium]